jgi:hypothetical protein
VFHWRFIDVSLIFHSYFADIVSLFRHNLCIFNASFIRQVSYHYKMLQNLYTNLQRNRRKKNISIRTIIIYKLSKITLADKWKVHSVCKFLAKWLNHYYLHVKISQLAALNFPVTCKTASIIETCERWKIAWKYQFSNTKSLATRKKTRNDKWPLAAMIIAENKVKLRNYSYSLAYFHIYKRAMTMRNFPSTKNTANDFISKLPIV